MEEIQEFIYQAECSLGDCNSAHAYAQIAIARALVLLVAELQEIRVLMAGGKDEQD